MNGQTEEGEAEQYIFSFAPKVSSGLDHFACVGYHKNKPTAFCWGGNASNQLGVGINTRECKVPTPVPFFEDLFVTSVCCTYYCTFVLAKRNAFDVGCSVYSFGRGNNGLLGFRKKRVFPSNRADSPAGGREKLLGKLDGRVDRTLLAAFGVGRGRRESPPSVSEVSGGGGGSGDGGSDGGSAANAANRGLLHFDVDKISSEEDSAGEKADEMAEEMAEEKADWFTPVPMKVKFPERTKIKFISCGDMHTLAICTKGVLYGWGSNAFGCVGNGTNANVYEPVCISLGGRSETSVADRLGGPLGSGPFGKSPPLHGEELNRGIVIHCSAGGKHSMACTLRGDMYSWGYGANGRLGLGNIQSYNKPQMVKRFQKRKRIIYVCSGKSHSGCIDAEGNVYTWGNGKYFKLGHGDDNDVLSPKRVECICCSRRIFMLSFGPFNSVALSTKGDVFLWGVFTKVRRGSSTYICKVPKKVNTNYKCLSVHASVYMAFGVTLVGDLIVLGDSTRVIASGGSGPSNVVVRGIHGGESDSAESNADVVSHLIGGGEKGSNQPHRGDLPHRFDFPARYVKELRGKVLIKDALRTFYRLDKESPPFSGGDNGWNEQPQWEEGANLYGDNPPEGALSKGGLIINSGVKTIDGSEHFTLFLLQNGKIYTSGVNKNGELANGEHNLGRRFPTPIPINVCVHKILKIACGYNYSLALSERGLLYGWGKNDRSQLGIGVTKDCYEPVHLKSLSRVIDVYAGHDHSACIVNDSFDEDLPRGDSQEVYLSSESSLERGELYTWGNAESGKVGLGADYTQGAILLPRRINLTSKVHRCSLGNSHSLFLTDSNELYVCGSANGGKLGLTGGGIGSSSGIGIGGSSIGSYMVSSPRKVPFDPSVYIKEVVAGATYSMVLSMDGFVYTWGELIKNEVASEAPTLYAQVSNVKHIVGGKDRHVLFHTYDGKLFGLGDNTHMQILHDVKEITIRGRPKLIPYFVRDRSVEAAYSFKNASFVQLEGNHDLFAWGYAGNGHLGIGATNVTHLKQPRKVIKSWVTYEEVKRGGDYHNDGAAEWGMPDGPLNPPFNEQLADEVQLVRRRVLRRAQFEDDLVCSAPYREEEVKNLIKEMHIMPHLLNWEAIQLLLKKERYTNSIQYIRSFERDLIDMYAKHMEFLLNLRSQERKYNELLLSYQHYVLSNVVMLGEERPSIMFSQHTHVLDCNRDKLQRFVYIVQQQPVYLVLLCLIHNSKNAKYGGGGSGGGGQQDEQHQQDQQLGESPHKPARKSPQKPLRKSLEKRSFYRGSTRVLCAFIFDLYQDLRDERVRTIFTIFLIKLGVEEAKNCLHVEALFREDTSIFFLLIRMLFLKNEVLAGFARSLADMGNANSFVRLVDSLARCRPGGATWKAADCEAAECGAAECGAPERGAVEGAPLAVESSPLVGPPKGATNRDALTGTSLSGAAPNRPSRSPPPCSRFIEEANDPLDKEFATFMKGKVPEKAPPLNLPIDMHIGVTPVQRTHLGGSPGEHPEVVAPPSGQNQMPKEPPPASQKDILIEIDMVHVFRELCRLFGKINFPEIFQVVIRGLFDHLSLSEVKNNREGLSENRIFPFSAEHLIYVPFFHLLLMGILGPMLRSVEKIAERFFFPVVPPHVTHLCKRVCTILEVLCINRYDCLSNYNLRESFVCVKFILEGTFHSMVKVTDRLCNTREDVYLTAYLNLFRSHLSLSPCYVHLKVFQLCHLLNLFFRFQNYLCLSFEDPAVEIVNALFAWQGGVGGKAVGTGGKVVETGSKVVGSKAVGVGSKTVGNKTGGTGGNAKQSGNFLLRLMAKGRKAKQVERAERPGKAVQPVQPRHPAEAAQDARRGLRLLFSESQLELFAQCKLVYNVQLETRFLLEERNMSICEFTRIPMPQAMCYRKKTRIKNREYLFSIIQEYQQPSGQVGVVSECLRGCPLFNPCRDTSTLLIKLKALRVNALSLAEQKGENLVGLIDKAMDIFLSSEMVYVDQQENIPPNLCTHKFRGNHSGLRGQPLDQSRQPLNQSFPADCADKGNSFFPTKWKNIATQICLDILKKKKHVNYLRKLHERQGKIEELLFLYQEKVKKSTETVKKALVFVSKLLIERPILVHATLFGKNLFFVKLKIEKNFRRERRDPCSLHRTSSVHVYAVRGLLQRGVLETLNEMLLPVVDLLSLEVCFTIDHALKLSLVVTGEANRRVLHVQTFRGGDIQRMYTRSPFISYSLFPYNGAGLCSLRALSLVHLLHDMVADLY
ncbi:guanidine nucleotide exchange factor [Plasmodium vivax Mauritania I]|uniref:Guanidine nucleotide exchange factor n=1 Tax=Plasmodium vivax Mauritania I TaxID=1035515 RepID=A0A0J9TCI8_PLAVI|nr:guanidine nucleotide exchange factor [Plasmodium vivax Mauritania I]